MGNGKTGICGQWNVHSNIKLSDQATARCDGAFIVCYYVETRQKQLLICSYMHNPGAS